MSCILDPNEVPVIGAFKQVRLISTETKKTVSNHRVCYTAAQIKEKLGYYKELDTWNKERVIFLLNVSKTAVLKGVVALYKRQTAEEKSSHQTICINGVGFNSVDSAFMSSIARQIIDGRNLSDKQLEVTRTKLFKYAEQLANIANENTRN